MSKLVIHPTVEKQLELVANHTSHGLLLSGKRGVGLYTIAAKLAKDIDKKASILTIAPDEKGVIKIEIIRKLYEQTRTKQIVKVVVIIDDADAMQIPAQNALLKLLEEPPEAVVFMLTSHMPQLLLPTVRSRVQEVKVLPVTSEQSATFSKSQGTFDATKQAQLAFLGQGLPAELTRLTADQEYFDKRSSELRQARVFLSGTTYEKLVLGYKVGSNRPEALTLVQDMCRILEATFKKVPNPVQATLLSNLLMTEEKLLNDAHVRTQLLKISLS